MTVSRNLKERKTNKQTNKQKNNTEEASTPFILSSLFYSLLYAGASLNHEDERDMPGMTEQWTGNIVVLVHTSLRWLSSEPIFMWEQNKPLTSFLKTYLKGSKETIPCQKYILFYWKKKLVSKFIYQVFSIFNCFPLLQVKGTEYEVIDNFSFNCWDEHSI